jgi:hypothetical protein
MNNKLGSLFLCLAFGLTAYVLIDFWSFERLPLIKKMQILWEEDLDTMLSEQLLPTSWNAIREIELVPGSADDKDWFKRLHVPIEIKKSGTFKLQIMLVNWEDEGKHGVYLQYDLVDLNSPIHNTVWENSRTLILDDPKSLYSRLSAKKIKNIKLVPF